MKPSVFHKEEKYSWDEAVGRSLLRCHVFDELEEVYTFGCHFYNHLEAKFSKTFTIQDPSRC